MKEMKEKEDEEKNMELEKKILEKVTSEITKEEKKRTKSVRSTKFDGMWSGSIQSFFKRKKKKQYKRQKNHPGTDFLVHLWFSLIIH